MKKNLIKNIKELLPYIFILIMVILIRTFVATPIKVNGSSMYKTLDGSEFMILNKMAKVERYDIVVVKNNSNELIKRVYGLPGEKIAIVGANGTGKSTIVKLLMKFYSPSDGIIKVNDIDIKEIDKYAFGKTSDYESITLGKDEYFVLGDNRQVSLDSRSIGPIKDQDIEGTANFIIYPFKKFGKLENK